MSHLHIQARNLPPHVELGIEPVIAPDAVIADCRFGRYTEVGQGVHMADSLLDDYSYLSRGCELMSVDIGKFSNIAAMVRINPGFHPMERVTLHHITYRRQRYGAHAQDDAEFFEWRRRQRVRRLASRGHRLPAAPAAAPAAAAAVTAACACSTGCYACRCRALPPVSSISSRL